MPEQPSAGPPPALLALGPPQRGSKVAGPRFTASMPSKIGPSTKASLKPNLFRNQVRELRAAAVKVMRLPAISKAKLRIGSEILPAIAKQQVRR